MTFSRYVRSQKIIYYNFRTLLDTMLSQNERINQPSKKYSQGLRRRPSAGEGKGSPRMMVKGVPRHAYSCSVMEETT